MTVSRALNNGSNVDGKTKARILKKAEEMGYTPNYIAKSLVSRKTFTIGVVIPEISHGFFAEVISGIEEIVYQKDYQLILTNSAENFEREKKAVRTLHSKRVDGILISSSGTTKKFNHLKDVIKSGTPIVMFDRCADELKVSTVRVNDLTGAQKVTQHMIDHGYKEIACLHGPNISIGIERLKGYKKALLNNNITINQDIIIECGFLENDGYVAMGRIFELPKAEWPRAVVTVNDPVAIGAIKRIEEENLSIPRDIAVAGFSDDIRSELLKCPLTTVKQHTNEMGKRAAEKLIKIIENKDEPTENIELKTELLIRNSCGCK